MKRSSGLKERAAPLKRELYALYLAYLHERTPWYAKAVIILTLAYAISPIDLIPDFIPVIGYLDDLIIVPAGISLSLRLVPPDVMEECRKSAASSVSTRLKWLVAALIILLWVLVIWAVWRAVSPIFP